MHDFLLAKEIIDEVLRVAKEKKLDGIKGVKLEIGSISLTHNDYPEHIDDIDPGNIRFILERLAQKNGLGKAIFDIKKIPGDNWKITNIEVE